MVLREKVRAVRRVRDIDGILGEIYQIRVKRRQCDVVLTDQREVSEELEGKRGHNRNIRTPGTSSATSGYFSMGCVGMDRGRNCAGAECGGVWSAYIAEKAGSRAQGRR